MSTHTNYCRQFLLWYERFRRSGGFDLNPPILRRYYATVAAELRRSVKVLLPAGGWTMGDPEARALIGAQFKPPHPRTAFEFSTGNGSGKNVLLLIDDHEVHEFKHTIAGVSVFSIYTMSAWDTWEIAQAHVADIPLERAESGVPVLHVGYGNPLPGVPETRGQKTEIDRVLPVAIDALNALACRNVQLSPSRFNRPKNATPKGAIPFDDYHVLTIDAPGKPNASEAHGGSHRSPREHLRRGHIRRLGSGPIWVNATVVNSGIGGKLFKDYAVRSA